MRLKRIQAGFYTTLLAVNFKVVTVLGSAGVRIHMFLGIPDPHPDPLVTSTDPDPDPSIIKHKY